MPDEIRYLIVSTARSGTNLLLELLNSHPDCFCGYEIFSPAHIARNHLPWLLDGLEGLDELCQLRLSNPVALIERLDRLTRERGFRCVGFKLMYFEADEMPAVRDYVFANPSLRIIHVHRRNALRRLVSLRRAQRTQQWLTREGDAPVKAPPVRVTLHDLVREMDYVRDRELAYGKLDETHQVLHLTYEDMIGDLQDTAQRMWSFLGLRAWDRLDVRSVRTGNLPLTEALANYDELREQLAELACFLD